MRRRRYDLSVRELDDGRWAWVVEVSRTGRSIASGTEDTESYAWLEGQDARALIEHWDDPDATDAPPWVPL